jgi:hypothetical protein
MTFAVAAGYGIAICVATVALIQLSSAARPRWSFDRSARRMPEAQPHRPSWNFR